MDIASATKIGALLAIAVLGVSAPRLVGTEQQMRPDSAKPQVTMRVTQTSPKMPQRAGETPFAVDAVASGGVAGTISGSIIVSVPVNGDRIKLSDGMKPKTFYFTRKPARGVLLYTTTLDTSDQFTTTEPVRQVEVAVGSPVETCASSLFVGPDQGPQPQGDEKGASIQISSTRIDREMLHATLVPNDAVVTVQVASTGAIPEGAVATVGIATYSSEPPGDNAAYGPELTLALKSSPTTFRLHVHGTRDTVNGHLIVIAEIRAASSGIKVADASPSASRARLETRTP